MRALNFIIVFISCSLYMNAQQGDIQIEQDDKIVELLDIYKEFNRSNEYYRIQVGFGSHAKALRIKSEVEIDFPGMYLRLIHGDPDYRVRLGRFKTKLEAERNLKKVRKKYPAAMLLKPKKSTR